MTEKYKEYTIVRLDGSNIKHIQTLSQAVWGHATTEDILYLKYYHPETEHAFLGYFAFDADGNAVGFQGANRLEIAYKNQTRMIAQWTDAMTHPAHREKGLFYYLSNRTHQLCKEKGMIMVIGYTNQNSFPLVRGKMGFKVADYLRGYHISIHTIPLEKMRLKVPFFQKMYKLYQDFIFSSYKIPYQIPYSFDREEFPIFLRGDNVTTYKQARGVFCLQIENTILWVKISRGLFIGDFQCPTEKEFLRVIQKLKQLCFWAGIRAIHFQSSKGSKEESYFAKYCPSFESFPLCYLDFGISFPMEKCKCTFGDIDVF